MSGQAKMLDGAALNSKVAYASYIRSGNTMLRKYIENIIGICTGSDGYIKMSNLDFAL